MTQTVYDSPVSGVGPYEFGFEYQKESDIDVSFYNPTTESYTLQPNTSWSLTTPGGSSVTLDATPAAEFTVVRIARNTDIDTMYATFYQGSAIRAGDLNTNFEQLQFAIQEQEYESGDLTDSIKDILGDISDINDIITDLSGITILANVTALNAYDPPDGSVGSAIQVSDSTGWSGANNVTGSPGGFTGDSNLRVNLRITNADTPTYAFISYSPVDPDSRYVNKAGDTMTGSLVLNADPSVNLGAATKQYVDTAVSSIPADNNTTYDFGAAVEPGNPTPSMELQLVGSDSTTDVVTIKKGSNITFTDVSSSGFTINASGSAIPGEGNVTISGGTGLDGSGTFNVNQSGNTTISLSLDSPLSGLSDVSSTPPAANQVLKWNGTAWAPAADNSGSGSTNLSWSADEVQGSMVSSTGTDAIIGGAIGGDSGKAGLMTAPMVDVFSAIPTTYLVKDFSTLDLLP